MFQVSVEEITQEGPQLDDIGLLYDFSYMKRALRDVISGMDHKFLNDLAPFDAINPSAENLAKYLYDETTRRMNAIPDGARITRITIWETDTTSASYWP